jgi:hypothetical protein
VSDADDPGGQDRQRKAFSGGDTLRRYVAVIPVLSPTAVAGLEASSLSPTQPAASRSGDDLDSACWHSTWTVQTSENVVGPT